MPGQGPRSCVHMCGPFSLPGIDQPRPDGSTLTVNTTAPYRAMCAHCRTEGEPGDFLPLAQLQVVHVRQPESPSPRKSRISMVSPLSQTNPASSHF